MDMSAIRVILDSCVIRNNSRGAGFGLVINLGVVDPFIMHMIYSGFINGVVLRSGFRFLML